MIYPSNLNITFRFLRIAMVLVFAFTAHASSESQMILSIPKLQGQYLYLTNSQFNEYLRARNLVQRDSTELNSYSPEKLSNLFRVLCEYQDHTLAQKLFSIWKKTAVLNGGLELGEIEFYRGLLLYHQGLFQEASDTFLRSVESMRPTSKSRVNDFLLAEAAYLTGRSAYLSDQYERADKYLEAAIRYFEQNQNKYPDFYMATLNYLGNLRRSEGYFDEARELLEKAQDFGKITNLQDTSVYAEVLNDIGLMEWFEKRNDVAFEFIKKGFDIRLRIFPMNHPSVTESIFNIAGILESKQLYDQTEELYRLCIDLTALDVQMIWVYKVSLLNFLLEMNRDDDAIEVIAQIEGALEKNLIKNLNERLAAEVSLAQAMVIFHDDNMADYFFSKAVETEIELVKIGANDEMRARNKYLQYLYRARKYEEAEKVFKQALEFRKVFYGPQHLVVASSQISLADHLIKQSRCTEAISLYKEALAAVLLHGDKPGLSRVILWQKLAQSYVNCSKLNEALEYARNIRKYFMKKNLSLSRHLDLLDMEGKLLLGLKNWSEALIVYKEGLDWLRYIPGDERPLIEGQFRSVLAELQIKELKLSDAKHNLNLADSIFIRRGVELPMHYIRWCEYNMATKNYTTAESYLNLASEIVVRKMETEFDEDLIPILQLKISLNIKLKNLDRAKQLIEESDQLISFNPGTSLKHIQINSLQENLKVQLKNLEVKQGE